ncbi:MAG: tetratricopeptide repeat protein [Halioglobus sp.]|nr:tetratricopeptide repeat protein [Halioglobus sp.]
MTVFLLACVGLILLSSLFFVFTPRRQGVAEEDLDEANRDWFLQRRREIKQEGGAAALEDDARLRLLEEDRPSSARPRQTVGAFPGWMLLPLVVVLATGLYYYLGAAEDVLIAQRLNSLSTESTPQEMRELIATVEQRSAARPDNLHYLAMLGRYYMESEEYARAAQSYDALVDAAPEDAQILAYSAQAAFLAAGRKLTDRVQLRAEQALALNPHQRTVLGMLGMHAFEQGQYASAIGYWQRLQAAEPAESQTARMIAGAIETARQRIGLSAVAGPTSAEDTSTVVGVTVTVEVPDDAVIDPGETVFVLARHAGAGSRMPIAVQRLTGAQLPLTLRLDDRHSMAGQTLSGVNEVIIAVQVSPDGRPGEGNATWLGQAGPVVPTVDGAPVVIVLQSNPERGAPPR